MERTAGKDCSQGHQWIELKGDGYRVGETDFGRIGRVEIYFESRFQYQPEENREKNDLRDATQVPDRFDGHPMTSLYPAVFDIPLDPKIKTLASILRQNDFQTAAFTGGGFMSSDYGVLNGFETADDVAYDLNLLKKRSESWLKQKYKQKFFYQLR